MKKLSFIIPVLALGMTVIGTTDFNINIESAEATVGSYETSKDTYYADIDTTLRGNDLLLELHDLMYETHKTYTSYSDVGSGLYQQYLDAYPGEEGYIRDFYTHSKLELTWNNGNVYNREHVWCQSLTNGLYGETYGGADMHHIRPTIKGLNSSRNNKLYGEVNESDDGYNKWNGYSDGDLISYYNTTTFEPHDEVKGDVARIVLYMYMHYNTRSNLGGSAATYTETGCSDSSELVITNIIDCDTEAEAFALLVEWNELDPVDDVELNRNEYAAQFQGNRNPFIDYPEFIDYIWGDEYYEGSSGESESGESSDGSGESSSGDSEESGSSSSSIVAEQYYFEKVTSDNDLEDGEYLIVYETNSVAFDGSLTSTINSESNFISVTIDDEIIYYSEDIYNATFTIESVGNGAYSILSSSGYYVYRSSDANGMDTSTSLDGTNTITISDGEADIVSSSAHFRYNASWPGFRYYRSSSYNSQQPVSLYKLVENEEYSSAIAFANDFNDKISNVCDRVNGNTDLSELTSVWTNLFMDYINLDDGVRAYFVDDSGISEIEECLDSYDYIVNKYSSLEDFMSRRNSSASNTISGTTNYENLIVIIVCSTLSILTLAAFIYILKSKKRVNK